MHFSASLVCIHRAILPIPRWVSKQYVLCCLGSSFCRRSNSTCSSNDFVFSYTSKFQLSLLSSYLSLHITHDYYAIYLHSNRVMHLRLSFQNIFLHVCMRWTYEREGSLIHLIHIIYSRYIHYKNVYPRTLEQLHYKEVSFE